MARIGILAYAILGGVVSYIIVTRFKISIPWSFLVAFIVATVFVGTYNVVLLIHFHWKLRKDKTTK